MDHYFLDSIGTMAVTRVSTCRVCASTHLVPILDLGEVAPSDFVPAGTHTVQKHPLSLVLCDPRHGCGLLQLEHVGCTPDDLYRQYWYKSGVNETMKRALNDIALDCQRRISLQPGDVIVDIGANDGTLLSFFPQFLTRVGVEPALNIQSDLSRHSTVNVPEYFTKKAYTKYVGKQQAQLITSLAMFYDLDNPISFTRDLKECLAPDGIWVNQMTYLSSMLSKNDYPNICHEHVTYYSLRTFLEVLKRSEMKLLDVELNDVNGGSLRTIVTHANATIQPSEAASARISALLDEERYLGLTTIARYREFAQTVRASKRELQSLIQKLLKEDKTIAVYGASTKGNTLLQYCRLAYPQISVAYDRNPDKASLFTVATHIPIVGDDQILDHPPDVLLILPWHFRDEFIKREAKFLGAGGTMIFPLPELDVVSSK